MAHAARTRDPAWVITLRAEVRSYLAARNLPQAALAEHLGLSEKHMSAVLTGRAIGSPALLDRMAAAVGCSITITVTHRIALTTR